MGVLAGSGPAGAAGAEEWGHKCELALNLLLLVLVLLVLLVLALLLLLLAMASTH
jgi:hypothetical protein